MSLPLLETVNGSVYFHQTTDVELVSFPLLSAVEGYVYFHQNASLESVSLPSLATVGQYLYFHGNAGLVDLVITDALVEVGEYISIVGSPSLCAPLLDWSSISDSVSLSGLADCEK